MAYQALGNSETLSSSVKNKKVPQTFRNLPVEIRYKLYKLLLPQSRVISLAACNREDVGFGPLSKTCKQINQEIKEWFFGSQTLTKRFIETPCWGRLDFAGILFELEIDEKCRKRYPCNWEAYFDNWTDMDVLTPPGYRMIRHLKLTFATEDTYAGRENSVAVSKLAELENLELLVFVIKIMHKKDRTWYKKSLEEMHKPGRVLVPVRNREVLRFVHPKMLRGGQLAVQLLAVSPIEAWESWEDCGVEKLFSGSF